MKRSFVISLVIALVALGLMSCDGTAISSPSIQAASKMVRTSAAGVRDTINLTDSLNVGDTVRLSLIVQGYYHYLTSFSATSDTTMLVGLAWNQADSAALAPGSDPEHGKVIFTPNSAYVFLTNLRFTPRYSGTHRIDMIVASSAGEPYSPQLYHYDVVVR